MDAFDVRLATREDLPEILAISNWAAANTPANFAVEPERLEAWTADWERMHAMYPWLVAASSDDPSHSILGFAKSGPHKGRCAYAWSAEISVYIHPDHHNRGIGRALYTRLIAILRDQGYASLLAGITLPNPASQRLHEAMGFKQVALYSRIGWKFGCWHDVGYWQMFLREGDPPAAIAPVLEVTSRAPAEAAP